MGDLEFTRLLLRLQKTDDNSEKSALYRSLSEQATALAASLEDPVLLPFEVKTDGSY
jgi:hypothetical protein